MKEKNRRCCWSTKKYQNISTDNRALFIIFFFWGETYLISPGLIRRISWILGCYTCFLSDIISNRCSTLSFVIVRPTIIATIIGLPLSLRHYLKVIVLKIIEVQIPATRCPENWAQRDLATVGRVCNFNSEKKVTRSTSLNTCFNYKKKCKSGKTT